MNRRRAVAAALWCLGTVGSVSTLTAQDRAVPIDTVHVSVTSRAGEQPGSSTRSVEILDRSRILGSPAQTVAEILEWGFGVDLMPRSPALVDIGMRGSTFEQVLVLVDGVRMRDGQTGHFNLNLTVPLEQVERIELLRGPAASLYGSDAMAGVINIVTRKGVSRTSASVAAGTFDRRAAALSHSQEIGGVWADLGGTVDRSDGHRTGTDYEMGGGRLVLTAPVGKQTLTGELAMAKRDFGADGFYGNFNSFEKTRTTTASVGAQLRVTEALAIDPVFRLRRNSDVFTLYRDRPTVYQNEHSTLQLGGDVVARVAMSNAVKGALGVHFFQDQVRSNSLGDRDETTAAVSAELTAEKAGMAALTLGVRADRLPTDDFLVAPGVSAAWWPVRSVRVHTSGGHSFRAPTWTERFYRDPANIGNAELSAERAWSADAGVDAYPAAGVRVSASGFVRDATDLIDWARPSDGSDPIWRTRNVDEARFTGLETEVEIEDILGVRLVARGSWISLESSAVAGFMSKYALRPEVESVSLAADRSFFDILRVSVRGANERRVGEESHLRLDSRVSVQARQARVYLDLMNGTDTDYLDISGRPVAGRNVVLGLELRRSGQ